MCVCGNHLLITTDFRQFDIQIKLIHRSSELLRRAYFRCLNVLYRQHVYLFFNNNKKNSLFTSIEIGYKRNICGKKNPVAGEETLFFVLLIKLFGNSLNLFEHIKWYNKHNFAFDDMSQQINALHRIHVMKFPSTKHWTHCHGQINYTRKLQIWNEQSQM